MIVDDHAVVRQGIRALLEAEGGFQVVGEAGSGGEAALLAADLAPDVVLMDLVMPEMDGVTATRLIKQRSPRSQVIVLTSYHEDEHIYPAIRAGALSYLLKSVGQDKQGVTDVSELVDSVPTMSPDDPALAEVAPELRDAFISGSAPVHDTSRLPSEFRGAPNGHEGSHHFLVDDFVRAVVDGTLPPVNAWTAARFNLPGIVAHESALRGR